MTAWSGILSDGSCFGGRLPRLNFWNVCCFQGTETLYNMLLSVFLDHRNRRWRGTALGVVSVGDALISSGVVEMEVIKKERTEQM